MGSQLGIEREPTSHFVTLNREGEKTICLELFWLVKVAGCAGHYTATQSVSKQPKTQTTEKKFTKKTQTQRNQQRHQWSPAVHRHTNNASTLHKHQLA